MTKHPAKLVRAEAKRVLGEYDHALEFNEDDEFLIMYGPNGVGKTKFLEIIHALSRLDGRGLSDAPFQSASLEYSDATKILVEISGRTLVTGGTEPSDVAGWRRTNRVVEFTLSRPMLPPSKWTYSGEGLADWLIAHTPYRPLEDEDIWEDRTDGELVHIDELESRYSESQPEGQSVPFEFRRFRDTFPSYLIETQRLKIEQNRPQRRARWRIPTRGRHGSTITEHASKMKSLLNEAQTEHSTITQQLDRTFPNRVLSSKEEAGDPENIRIRYEEQNKFRSRLGRVASVELEDALSLPDRELAPWELQLLHLYLDDADAKLNPFEGLLQKIELLEEIVNSRLLNKRLQVTAKHGLSVLHEQDGRTIDLDSLSSGEQHEIILMFHLLFNVPPNALVMIDEPEISLHVVWQMAFIPDVQRIAKLTGYRFIVATHSPQIINDAWAHAVRLGPPEVPFT